MFLDGFKQQLLKDRADQGTRGREIRQRIILGVNQVRGGIIFKAPETRFSKSKNLKNQNLRLPQEAKALQVAFGAGSKVVSIGGTTAFGIVVPATAP